MSQFSNGWSPLPAGGGTAGGQPIPGAPGAAPACPVFPYPGPGDPPGGAVVGWKCWAAGSAHAVVAFVQYPSGAVLNTAGGEQWISANGASEGGLFGAADLDAAVAACCGGPPPPKPPPPPAPAPSPGQPPAPPQPAPPPAPAGASCPPEPCPLTQPVRAVDPAVAPSPGAPSELTSCLPGFGEALVSAAAGKSLVDMLRAVGFVDKEGRQIWYDRAIASLADNKGLWGDLGRGAANTAGWLIQQIVPGLQATADATAAVTGCDKGTAPLLIAVQLLVGAWRRWVGEVPEPLTGALDYLTNYACAIGIPEQAELDDLRSRRAISLNAWQCMTKMHGNNPTHQRRVVANRYEWPTVEQVVQLERRGRLPAGEINRLWNNAHCPTKDQRDDFRAAAEFVPTPTDASEWMSKDLGDPLLTQTFGLFNEFRQKYRGDVKDALDFSGVSEKWARLIFASHRGKAAPHQMYEMHKRLRPGWWANLPAVDALHMAQAIAPRRPQGEGGLLEQASNLEFLGQQREVKALYGGDPDALARFGGRQWVQPVVSPDPKILVPADLTGLPPQWLDEIGEDEEAARAYLAETVTSGFHVFEGLSQANYPPFWRARLLALSYSVLTRVDMRRAYETGQLDRGQLVEKLQDRGYTPVDSGYLAGFYEQAAIQLASRRPAVGAWVNDGYDISLLQQALLDQGMREEMWPAVKRIAENRRQILIQQRCIRHLKKLAVAGLVEEKAIKPRLVAIGLTDPEAERLRGEWACEMRAIPKAESAAQVCKYLKENLIGPEQAARLIHRLGYTWQEARRMVGACLLEPVRKGTKTRADLPAAVAQAKVDSPVDDQESGISAEDKQKLADLRAALASAGAATRPGFQLAVDALIRQLLAAPGMETINVPPPDGG